MRKYIFLVCLQFLINLSLSIVTLAMSEIGGVEYLGPSKGLQSKSKIVIEIYGSLNNTNDIYMIADNSLYKSADGGKSFIRIRKNINHKNQYYYNYMDYKFKNKLIVDPYNPQRIILKKRDLIEVSEDGGFSWRSIKISEFGNIGDVAILQGKIFVVSNNKLFEATTKNYNFREISSFKRVSHVVTGGNYVYVIGTKDNNPLIFVSSDRGATYQEAYPIKFDFFTSEDVEFFVNPYNPRMIVVISESNKPVFLSLNAGKNFVDIGLLEHKKYDVGFTKDSIFIATNYGLYKNNQLPYKRWQFIYSNPVYSLYINNQVIIIGKQGCYSISNNGGKSFANYAFGLAVMAPPWKNFGNKNRIFINKEEKKLYVIIGTSKLYEYNLENKKWKLLVNHSDLQGVGKIGNKIFIFISWNPLYWTGPIKIISNNLKLKKLSRISLRGTQVRSEFFYVIPFNTQQIYCCGGIRKQRKLHGGLLFSSDGGSQWKFFEGNFSGFCGLCAVDIYRQKFYIVTYFTQFGSLRQKGLWVSQDKTNWKFLGISGVFDISITPNRVFVTTDHGLFVSEDGINFSLLDVCGVRTIYKICVDHSNPRCLFAITSDGLYKSTDGGNTWTKFRHFINKTYIFYDLIKNGNYWYAATDSGVIRFKDTLFSIY